MVFERLILLALQIICQVACLCKFAYLLTFLRVGAAPGVYNSFNSNFLLDQPNIKSPVGTRAAFQTKSYTRTHRALDVTLYPPTTSSTLIFLLDQPNIKGPMGKNAAISSKMACLKACTFQVEQEKCEL